jgi:succinate dehydrogenase / fumarate reductase cytochrome b subunit
MLVSILHRVTGGAITVVGLAILGWWLAAIAGGDESYAKFVAVAGHPAGLIVLAGLTWAFCSISSRAFATSSSIRALAMSFASTNSGR